MKFYLLIVCTFILKVSINSCQLENAKSDKKKDNYSPLNVKSPESAKKITNFLSKKELLFYIDTAKSITPSPKNGYPFNEFDYDKIIAYDFKGHPEMYSDIIDKRGDFVPVVLKQQYLTQKQADKILSKLSNKSSYGELTSACFYPHLAFVFYKNSKVVVKINICLDCNRLESSIHIPAQHNKNGDEEIGLTKSGRSAIISLCKELGFTYGNLSDY